MYDAVEKNDIVYRGRNFYQLSRTGRNFVLSFLPSKQTDRSSGVGDNTEVSRFYSPTRFPPERIFLRGFECGFKWKPRDEYFKKERLTGIKEVCSISYTISWSHECSYCWGLKQGRRTLISDWVLCGIFCSCGGPLFQTSSSFRTAILFRSMSIHRKSNSGPYSLFSCDSPRSIVKQQIAQLKGSN